MITTPANGHVNPIENACTSRPISASGDVFCKALMDAQRPPTAPVAGLTGINPMLLHEISLSEKRRRDGEARRRGKALLEALTELQLLTLGAGSIELTLDRLTDLLASIPQADDPGLASVVRGIAVRAAVELGRTRPA